MVSSPAVLFLPRCISRKPDLSTRHQGSSQCSHEMLLLRVVVKPTAWQGQPKCVASNVTYVFKICCHYFLYLCLYKGGTQHGFNRYSIMSRMTALALFTLLPSVLLSPIFNFRLYFYNDTSSVFLMLKCLILYSIVYSTSSMHKNNYSP